MTLTSPFGLVLGCAVIAFAALSGVKSAAIFFNAHAALVVVVGTLAASLTCFPLSRLKELVVTYFSGLFGTNQSAERVIAEIVRLASVMIESGSLSAEWESIRHPFLRECVGLMDEGGLSEIELDEVLMKRLEQRNEIYRRDSLTFKTLGKFPPAFGLVGTTVGMVNLLQGIGEADAFERLGPAMSMSLVATFYGLVLANVVLLPISENLLELATRDLTTRRIIVDGIRLLRAQKHPLLVEEYLNSYLPAPKVARLARPATGAA